ncbi:MAG: serine/threonine protein kinase [Deltaproteobacteria bacterium]|nr:serine/threonine protein kinase [Deltaproteobacteria bacterium]
MNLGRYELCEKLSTGGMGEVFRARIHGAEGFKRDVAIKRIHPHLSAKARHREMFVREAKLLATLSHPNIVQVYELASDGAELFIVMQYVHGADLARLIPSGVGMAPEQVAVIARDVLAGLEFAHGRCDETGQPLGIVHRDLTPDNLLVDLLGTAKLCDFGVARVAEGTGTKVGEIRGKLSYMAPEQVLGLPADPRTDLFALGAVLYEALTGKRLLRDQLPPEQISLLREVANPLERCPLDSVPRKLADAIWPALCWDPSRRYPSAATFREELEKYVVTFNAFEARARLTEKVREAVRPLPGHGEQPPPQRTSRMSSDSLRPGLTLAPGKEGGAVPISGTSDVEEICTQPLCVGPQESGFAEKSGDVEEIRTQPLWMGPQKSGLPGGTSEVEEIRTQPLCVGPQESRSPGGTTEAEEIPTLLLAAGSRDSRFPGTRVPKSSKRRWLVGAAGFLAAACAALAAHFWQNGLSLNSTAPRAEPASRAEPPPPGERDEGAASSHPERPPRAP